MKWDTDRQYLMESIEKASNAAGISVSGGKASVGVNWSKSSETAKKFDWAIAARGYEQVPVGGSSCY